MSYGRHRRPRWHDRPRAWLRGWLDWLTSQHQWDGTDDHGNPIGDLFHRTPPAGSRVWRTQQVGGVHLPLYGKPSPPGYNPAWSAAAFRHDVPREVMPLDAVQQRMRSTNGSGALVDVSRPVSSPSGPGHRNLPRPRFSSRQAQEGLRGPRFPREQPNCTDGMALAQSQEAWPGQLTVWDYKPATRPGFWAPRPDDTIIETAPRIRPEIRRALAGAW